MVNSNTNRRIEINRSIIKNDHQYVQYIQRSRIEYSRSFFILQDILFFMDNIVPLAPQIIWTVYFSTQTELVGSFCLY